MECAVPLVRQRHLDGEIAGSNHPPDDVPLGARPKLLRGHAHAAVGAGALRMHRQQAQRWPHHRQVALRALRQHRTITNQHYDYCIYMNQIDKARLHNRKAHAQASSSARRWQFVLISMQGTAKRIGTLVPG